MPSSARALRPAALAAAVALLLAGCGADRGPSLTDLNPGYAPLAGNATHDPVTGRFAPLETGLPAYDAFFADLTLVRASRAAGRQVLTNVRSGLPADAALARSAVPAAVTSLSAAGAKIPALRAKAASLTATAATDLAGVSGKDAILTALIQAKDELLAAPGDLTALIVDLKTLPPAK